MGKCFKSSLTFVALILVQNTTSALLNERAELVGRDEEVTSVCLEEHNNHRKQNDKEDLIPDAKLVEAARKHNEVMVAKRCFSHRCNGEPKLGDRVTKEGYIFSNVGEIIAAGQPDCVSVLKVWMNSSGHKKIILGDFEHIGCHFKPCTASRCRYKTYWTCVFGTPK